MDLQAKMKVGVI